MQSNTEPVTGTIKNKNRPDVCHEPHLATLPGIKTGGEGEKTLSGTGKSGTIKHLLTIIAT